MVCLHVFVLVGHTTINRIIWTTKHGKQPVFGQLQHFYPLSFRVSILAASTWNTRFQIASSVLSFHLEYI